MVEAIAIHPDAAVAMTKADSPSSSECSCQPQFGMSFEEQQEVLYQTLLAFQESDLQ